MTTSDSLPAFDKLWNYGEPAQTESKFREILPVAEASNDRAYLAELLTQIARTQGLQDRFDDAHMTLDRVEAMLIDNMQRPRVRYLLERGRVFNSSGQPLKALPLFLDACDVADSASEERLYLDAVHMVAIAQPEVRDKITWNLKGIELIRTRPNQKGWLYAFYNNLGEAYAQVGDDQRALETFEKMVALDVENGKEPELYSQKDVAKFLRRVGRVDDALKILRPLEVKLAKEDKRDGFIEMEIAECLLAQGKTDEARDHCAEAHRQLANDKWVMESDPASLERMKKYAKLG